jgi:hypothetical protein
LGLWPFGHRAIENESKTPINGSKQRAWRSNRQTLRISVIGLTLWLWLT